jgi:LysM repeat protein
MRKIKYVLIALVISFSTNKLIAQETVLETSVYKPKLLEFKGVDLNQYLRFHIKCLKPNEDYNLQFIVEKNGSISDLKDAKGIIDEKCLSKIKLFIGRVGVWQPGKNIDREPVRVLFNLSLKNVSPDNYTTNENKAVNEKDFKIHKIKTGETLYGISKMYNVTTSAILSENEHIIDGLSVGQEIKIPIENNNLQKEQSTVNKSSPTVGCISGDCNTGIGTYLFPKGEKYVGEFKNGTYNGKGTFSWPNGQTYTGGWKNGAQNGFGTFTYSNGKTETGEWENNNLLKDVIKSNLYNINFIMAPHMPEIKTNLKVFKNIIATNNSIFSVMFSPPSGGIRNQMAPTIGSFFLKTNNNITKSINDIDKPQESFNVFGAYKKNNNLSELNKIYSISRLRDYVLINETTIDLDADKPNETGSFKLLYEFELKANSNVETFVVKETVIGNGLGAFKAYSTFNEKTYLFLYRYRLSSPYLKIDLNAISNNFDNSRKGSFFKGILDGKTIQRPWSVEDVIQNEKYTFIFLNLVDMILPVRIDNSNNSITILYESVFFMGNCRIQEYTQNSICNDGFFYMPFSNGFVNYYYNYNKTAYLIKLFDNSLKKLWQTEISDIVINHVYESGNYIIIGGYSTAKGYLGYPNPKVIVINRQSKLITYEKVIAKKNGEIGYITTNKKGEIILGVGSYCCQSFETDEDFIPQIIIDKLNSNGVFENDLFVK